MPRMPLPDDFEAAQRKVKTLKSTPSSDELLDLYGLYKQANAGDVSGSRPSLLDFKGRANTTRGRSARGSPRTRR